MMKPIYILLLCIGLAACEPKDNYIDTGISVGKHDCSIYEYMHKSPNNWDSTILMIKHAGLVELFDGAEEITFWGITSNTIRHYMLWSYERVTEIPTIVCKDILERHVVRGRYMTKDVAFRIPDISGVKKGGTRMTSINNSDWLAYKLQDELGGIPNTGAIHLYLESIQGHSNVNVPLASPDIDCKNGVVHSLNYEYSIK